MDTLEQQRWFNDDNTAEYNGEQLAHRLAELGLYDGTVETARNILSITPVGSGIGTGVSAYTRVK